MKKYCLKIFTRLFDTVYINFLLLLNKSPHIHQLKIKPICQHTVLQIRSLDMAWLSSRLCFSQDLNHCVGWACIHTWNSGYSFKLMWLWQDSVPCGCRIALPISLLAISQVPLSAPSGHSHFSPHAPHRFSQGESPLCPSAPLNLSCQEKPRPFQGLICSGRQYLFLKSKCAL